MNFSEEPITSNYLQPEAKICASQLHASESIPLTCPFNCFSSRPNFISQILIVLSKEPNDPIFGILPEINYPFENKIYVMA